MIAPLLLTQQVIFISSLVGTHRQAAVLGGDGVGFEILVVAVRLPCVQRGTDPSVFEACMPTLDFGRRRCKMDGASGFDYGDHDLSFPD